MCRGRLLRSSTLARKVYKSLMSEGLRKLKWTCPLCFIEKGNGTRGQKSFLVKLRYSYSVKERPGWQSLHDIIEVKIPFGPFIII